MDDVAHAGDPAGDVELVVEGAGACLGTSVMDRACSTPMNRPVRTRTHGGVTGTAREGLPMSMCAEHVQQLGGESPLPNLMEVKG